MDENLLNSVTWIECQYPYRGTLYHLMCLGLIDCQTDIWIFWTYQVRLCKLFSSVYCKQKQRNSTSHILEIKKYVCLILLVFLYLFMYLFSHLRLMYSLGIAVSACSSIWSRLKYLNNHVTDYHDTLYRHL